MNTKVKWFIDDPQGVFSEPKPGGISFFNLDEKQSFDAYFFLCNVKKKDSDWSVLHKGTSDEDFHKTLKQHCENHMNDGIYDAYVIHSYGISLDKANVKIIPEHCYVQLKPKKKEPKVFLNGPKKNTEFLAKKGKHYVSSNNHPA